ncbi:MAG: hypothetical protein NVSMB67_09140 [Flavisolibacter sp.]
MKISKEFKTLEQRVNSRDSNPLSTNILIRKGVLLGKKVAFNPLYLNKIDNYANANGNDNGVINKGKNAMQ